MSTVIALRVMDAQGGHGLPERAPALGEHAGPHGVARRHKRHQITQNVAREGADAVFAAVHCLSHVFLIVKPLRHSVEHVTYA
jgi:hypothetical protein